MGASLNQPCRVQEHDQRIVSGAHLPPAAREQPRGVAARKRQLAQPLQRDECQNQRRKDHVTSETHEQEKPGPIAVMTVRLGRPAFSNRSITNTTVGADMFP